MTTDTPLIVTPTPGQAWGITSELKGAIPSCRYLQEFNYDPKLAKFTRRLKHARVFMQVADAVPLINHLSARMPKFVYGVKRIQHQPQPA